MNNLLQEYHNRIDELFASEKLLAESVEAVIAPLFVTFKYKLSATADKPLTAVIQRATKLGSAIETVLGVKAARIVQNSGLLEIQIPSPRPQITSALQMVNNTSNVCVAVGLDEYGEPVTVDLSQNGCVGWIAPSRRGKTESMKATLLALAASNLNVCYTICCLGSKRDNWQGFDNKTQCMGIVTDFAEIETVFKFFGWVCTQPKAKKISILVIDDVPAIMPNCAIADEMATIASTGAGLGVHLLLGTQDGISKTGVGSQLVANNMTARICYRPSSKTSGSNNAGSNSFDLFQLSDQKGDGVLIDERGGVRIATALTKDNHFNALKNGVNSKIFRLWNQNFWRKSGGVNIGVTGGVEQGVNENSHEYTTSTPPSTPLPTPLPTPLYTTFTPPNGVKNDGVNLENFKELTPKLSTGELTKSERQTLYFCWLANERKMNQTQVAAFGSKGTPQSNKLKEVIREFEPTETQPYMKLVG